MWNQIYEENEIEWGLENSWSCAGRWWRFMDMVCNVENCHFKVWRFLITHTVWRMVICPRSLSIQVNGNRDHVAFCQVQANRERFFKQCTHVQSSCFYPVRSAHDFRYQALPLFSRKYTEKTGCGLGTRLFIITVQLWISKLVVIVSALMWQLLLLPLDHHSVIVP